MSLGCVHLDTNICFMPRAIIEFVLVAVSWSSSQTHWLRKFGISHWFTCGADGPADKWSRNHQNFSDGQISKFHRYAWGPACMRDLHTWSSSIGRKLKGAFKNLKNNANMNEWMNGKAYPNMHWKLLEKPDISRVLPLLNHWGRGSTLEMSSFSNLFNAYNVFWWTWPFITIIYFNRGIIEWVWDSFIDGMLSPRTQWSKFVDGLITEFFKQSYM